MQDSKALRQVAKYAYVDARQATANAKRRKTEEQEEKARERVEEISAARPGSKASIPIVKHAEYYAKSRYAGHNPLKNLPFPAFVGVVRHITPAELKGNPNLASKLQFGSLNAKDWTSIYVVLDSKNKDLSRQFLRQAVEFTESNLLTSNQDSSSSAANTIPSAPLLPSSQATTPREPPVGSSTATRSTSPVPSIGSSLAPTYPNISQASAFHTTFNEACKQPSAATKTGETVERLLSGLGNDGRLWEAQNHAVSGTSAQPHTFARTSQLSAAGQPLAPTAPPATPHLPTTSILHPKHASPQVLPPTLSLATLSTTSQLQHQAPPNGRPWAGVQDEIPAFLDQPPTLNPSAVPADPATYVQAPRAAPSPPTQPLASLPAASSIATQASAAYLPGKRQGGPAQNGAQAKRLRVPYQNGSRQPAPALFENVTPLNFERSIQSTAAAPRTPIFQASAQQSVVPATHGGLGTQPPGRQWRQDVLRQSSPPVAPPEQSGGISGNNLRRADDYFTQASEAHPGRPNSQWTSPGLQQPNPELSTAQSPLVRAPLGSTVNGASGQGAGGPLPSIGTAQNLKPTDHTVGSNRRAAHTWGTDNALSTASSAALPTASHPHYQATPLLVFQELFHFMKTKSPSSNTNGYMFCPFIDLHTLSDGVKAAVRSSSAWSQGQGTCCVVAFPPNNVDDFIIALTVGVETDLDLFAQKTVSEESGLGYAIRDSMLCQGQGIKYMKDQVDGSEDQLIAFPMSIPKGHPIAAMSIQALIA